MICKFFKHYMPAHTFTSVILQQGVVTSVHRDSRNAEDSSNLLVSLTPVNGPILWVEDSQGDTQCPDPKCSSVGTVGLLLKNPARFNPRCLHCTVVSSGRPADAFATCCASVCVRKLLSFVFPCLKYFWMKLESLGISCLDDCNIRGHVFG